MKFQLNTEPIKYAVIVLSMPFWLPFFRALLREFNDALRDEGGLLGRAPTPRELKKLNAALGKFESPMLSERGIDVRRNAPTSTAAQRATGAKPRRGFRATR